MRMSKLQQNHFTVAVTMVCCQKLFYLIKVWNNIDYNFLSHTLFKFQKISFDPYCQQRENASHHIQRYPWINNMRVYKLRITFPGTSVYMSIADGMRSILHPALLRFNGIPSNRSREDLLVPEQANYRLFNSINSNFYIWFMKYISNMS